MRKLWPTLSRWQQVFSVGNVVLILFVFLMFWFGYKWKDVPPPTQQQNFYVDGLYVNGGKVVTPNLLPPTSATRQEWGVLEILVVVIVLAVLAYVFRGVRASDAKDETNDLSYSTPPTKDPAVPPTAAPAAVKREGVGKFLWQIVVGKDNPTERAGKIVAALIVVGAIIELVGKNLGHQESSSWFKTEQATLLGIGIFALVLSWFDSFKWLSPLARILLILWVTGFWSTLEPLIAGQVSSKWDPRYVHWGMIVAAGLLLLYLVPFPRTTSGTATVIVEPRTRKSGSGGSFATALLLILLIGAGFCFWPYIATSVAYNRAEASSPRPAPQIWDWDIVFFGHDGRESDVDRARIVSQTDQQIEFQYTWTDKGHGSGTGSLWLTKNDGGIWRGKWHRQGGWGIVSVKDDEPDQWVGNWQTPDSPIPENRQGGKIQIAKRLG